MFKVHQLAKAVAFSLFGLSAAVVAQDFVPAPETVVEQEVTPAAEVVAESVMISADEGVQAVSEVATAPYVQASEIAVSAEDQLNEYLASKGWSQGWDPKRKRMFVVYSESFDVEDPSYDTDFITKRSLYATMAVMGAKAKVAEYMRTEMSAQDMLTMPGNDVHDQLAEKYKKQEKRIEAQKNQLVQLLQEVDKAEAEKLAGVTWDDLSKEMMAAAIKKLDASFSAGQIEAKKEKIYQRAKARYDEAYAELEKLQQQAEALSGQVKQEMSSSVETLAKAPIMGATLLAQAESWDAENEQYQVAVLMVWSEQLENSASAILAGNPQPTKPRNGMSVGEWARKQDLATLAGPRQFIDANGDRWFIGGYGAVLEGSSSAQRAAKGIADLFARKEAAVSLFADLETQKQAQIAAETRNSGALNAKDSTAIAQNFAETTRQSIENRQISGISKIMSKTIKHPVSGHKMYVVLYGISAQSAADALKAEARNYAHAIEAAKNNNYQTGMKAGLNQQMDAARNDEKKQREGVQAAKAAVAEVKPAAPVRQQAPSEAAVKKSGPTASKTIFAAPTVGDDDF